MSGAFGSLAFGAGAFGGVGTAPVPIPVRPPVGTPSDMLQRLIALLPTGWFPDQQPILDVLLQSYASADSWLYGLIEYIQKQTRLSTAQDIWLDGYANDFFGSNVTREPGQGDLSFRATVGTRVLQERVTRPAMIQALTNLTGYVPRIFQPSNAADTGGLSSIGDTAGKGMQIGGGMTPAYGAVASLNYPFQFFITAYRPAAIVGASGLMGIYYNDGSAVYGGIGSAVNHGATCGHFEIQSLSLNDGRISDLTINALINATRPINSIAWVLISSGANQQQIGTGYLLLNGSPLLLNGIPLVLTNVISENIFLVNGQPFSLGGDGVLTLE